jgi:predicted secreted hydrolase
VIEAFGQCLDIRGRRGDQSTMMRNRIRWIRRFSRIWALGLALMIAPATPGHARAQTPPLAEISPGFRQVIGPRNWTFPADHGKHDGYKTEWWYFSGNLRSQTGRRFGYQLTFFRVASAPSATTQPNGLVAHDLYFVHAAISDIAGKRFVFKDRMERERSGVAEASDHTLDVHMKDWRAKLDDRGKTVLTASEAGFEINLTAAAGVGPVLEGPGGVNAKGPNRGQASYYYSEPLMPTHGTLTIGSESFAVDGASWMDHEFSSNPLSGDQVGWDWMAVSFSDRSSLMLYRIRSQGGASDYVSGTVISAEGEPRYLSASEIQMGGSKPWRSPNTDAEYPQQWRVLIAGHKPIIVRTLMPGQELITPNTTAVNYFEGAAEAVDEAGNALGEGYLEMTGYDTRGQTLLGSVTSFLRIAKEIWLTP